MATNYLNLAEIDNAVNQNKMAKIQRDGLMQNLLRQKRQDEQEMQTNNAFRDSIGQDGNLDNESLYKKLLPINAEKAVQYKDSITKRKLEEQRFQNETQNSELDRQIKLGEFTVNEFARVAPGDTAGWIAAKQRTAAAGSKVAEGLPDVYDEKAHMALMMNGKSWLEQNKPKSVEIAQLNDGTVYDKNNPQGIKIGGNYSKPEKPESKPASVQEYEYAKTQGFNGSFQDYQTSTKPNKSVETSTGLRKEFDDLPEVKNYKLAKTAYKSIEDASKRNTTASDINIVYGIAKLYDPTSVVREGEYATVANSPNIPEKVKGLAQYLSNGGRLTPQTKKDILAEAQSRISAYENEYLPQRKNYEDIAKNSGADPKLVFPSDFTSAKPTVEPPPKGATGKTNDPRYEAWKKANGKK